MGVYKIADLNVRYEPTYDLLRSRSEKYLLGDVDKVNMELCVREQSILDLKARSQELDDETCEYMLTGLEFYLGLICFNGMMLHASAVELDGEAYLFSAPCGTGKSTHTQLWKQYFGDDRVKIINDDKPAIRIRNGQALIYGTPFSGKYDINENRAVPLKAISFIYQSPQNVISEMTETKAIYALLNQSVRPRDPERAGMLLQTISDILDKTRIYNMGCDMSDSAVIMSYNAMKEGRG